MEEDGTCLLDVINDPDALGAFLTSDQQDEEDSKQTMDNMDIMADDGGGIGSSSSSKPAYPDFLSMAMAEANLEPDFGSLDQEPFFTATVDSAELGGVPEQRTSVTLDSLVEDTNISANNANEEGSVGIIQVKDEPVKTHETSAAAKTAISAVQRLISQSSQPLHHGALAPDIPTQKMIHYKAEDHPPGSKLLGEAIGQAGGIIQPISIQAGTSQVVTNPVQQLTTQALDSLQHKQVSAKQLATQQQLVQQSGQGLQLNAQLQSLSPAVQQQTGLQQVLIGQSHQLQGAGNVQQLVLGSVQPQINVIQGQANIIQPGHLGTQVLQLQRPQLRPKMGVVGAQPAMKQIQLVLNPQTGVISQVPGNIQLRGQLISQQPGMIGSPQVIIQNQTQQQQQPQHSQAQQATSKAKTITTSATVSSQPVITMAASEGNIIVLTNSTPIAQTSVSQKTNTVTVNSSTTHVASSSSNSNSQPSKQSKSKPGKTSKTKSRRSQQRTSSSSGKPVTTVSVTTVTNSSAGGQSQSVQSLGSIPSIQASSPSPVTSLSNASGLTSAGGPIATRIGQAVTTSQNNVLQHLNIPGIKQGTLTIRNKDPPNSVVVSGSSVHTSEPAPVISHQAGTVHYRPRQVVTKQQSDKNPALQQLVQNLRAQGDNERLRSLRQLQKLLQQNPQASQQLQELMKSKLVGTKPEVSVKKPPVTSSDVTKPPNVYLQPQPANSLPFQTGSKLFNTSAPSGGLTIPPLFINKSNARMSHSLIVPTSTEVSKPSTLQNLSGVLSSFVNQATTATSTLQQVRFSEDKDTFLDNLDFLDAKTVGQTAAPAGESHLAIPGVNQSPVTAISAATGSSLAAANGNSLLQPTQKITVTTAAAQSFTSNPLPLSSVQLSVGSDSSAVLDAPSSVSQATAQYSVGLANAATGLLNNQPKLVVSTLAETISSLVNTSKASFMNKNPPAREGKDDKRELNVGVSAIRGLQGQPEVAATLRVTSPVQQAPVQAARPEMIQSASLQNLNANSGVVSRPAITLTSEQIGIRAQQQLQQIQARIQQLMSRQVRSDIENRQLQQLLHYRQKVIVKVKAQLAQLSHQQRLANLSMGQQSRDKTGTADAGPVTPPSSQINVGAMSTPSSQINIGTVSTAAQVATKAGGAFSSLLVPHGQATGKNASTGLNVHVLAQSPQQQQQQQQYSPSVSPAGVSGQKQIQNALITSTTSKQDTLKNVRVGKHKNSESDKKNQKKIKMTSEPNITLSQSLNFKGSNSTESSALKAKLEEGSSSLSNSLPAGQLQFQSGGSTQGMSMQRAHLSKTTQVKPQQYQQTMKMLEEKLRSMSPAQQRQFLMQYQPLLQKLSLAGQKIMAGKAAAASQSSLASSNSQPEQGATAQRKTSQGSMSKESKSPKRNSSKPVTPTLLQLISGEVAEAKTKKHEKMMKKQNRSEMLLQQLKKDQRLVTHAELKREFTSRSEAVGKLLAFHVCQNDSPMEEHLEKFDKEFEDHSMHLLDKKDEMLAKYRYLLLRESMRRGPSAEMVMLDRMVLQDERMNFEYEKQLSKNPDTQNRLLAIIKPNQSKKERFLSAAAAAAALSSSIESPAIPVIPKQETSLPPKKRALIEPVVTVKPLEPEVSTISEVPISEPQITKNDFKTKITIKIPKQSYQPLSPSPSSCDTIHSTVSSPDLRSPKSEAGSESGASSVRSDISSPRVRLRRHSTLQALLMSDSPLDVSMDELKGKKKPWKQTSNSSSLSSSDKTPAKDTAEKASRSRRNGKDGLTNGRRSNSSAVSEEAMSVFDFDEDTGSKDSYILPVSAANSPFEPMDVLQDSLQDEMNSTINSILGLQKASPGEGSQQEDGGGGGSQDTLLPSAVFESHSIDDDDDFYDSVDTLSKITSYSSMLDSGGEGMPGDGSSSRDAVASLQAELDIMMEGDDSQESKPSDHDLEAAVNSILF